MTTEGTKRKLAAILSADVKEYSRLMSQDERGTIRTLTAYKEAISSLIQEYKGRVVDAPGDNLLAEFGSVVDAVNCAVEIQRELSERNADLPPARQMEFRIGINIGDIVEEEKRIYGDGVNIAAREQARVGVRVSGRTGSQEYRGACAGLPGAVFPRCCRPQSGQSQKGCETELAQYYYSYSSSPSCGSGCGCLAFLLPSSSH
jgi:hypothetical protein